MNNINSQLLEQFKQRSENLLFMSESDYPFTAFLWNWQEQDALTPEKLLQHTGRSLNTPVEVVDLGCFFRNATTPQDWYGLEEEETLKKYQALVETLKHNLSDIKVYRVGTIDIDVYIVGKTPSGDYAGLFTKVVET
jgi:hypothetical protein